MAGVVNTTSPIKRSRTSKMFKNLFLYGRLVDEHHGNVVLDRIHTMTGIAFQTRAIVHENDGCLAAGTRQNLEQFSVDGHEKGPPCR